VKFDTQGRLHRFVVGRGLGHAPAVMFLLDWGPVLVSFPLRLRPSSALSRWRRYWQMLPTSRGMRWNTGQV